MKFHPFKPEIMKKAYPPHLLFSRIVGIVLCAGLSLFYAGCGEPKAGSAAPAAPLLNFGKKQLPPEITEKLVLYETNILAELPRQNPFDSPLIKVEIPVEGEGAIAAEPVIPRVDPFVNITLTGILRGKQPLAVLGINNKKVIVRQGEVLTNTEVDSAPSVEIAQIDKNSVSLYSPNEYIDLSVKTLELPSLIGFKSTVAKAAPEAGAEGEEEQADPTGFLDSEEFLSLPPEMQEKLRSEFEAKEGASKSNTKTANKKSSSKNSKNDSQASPKPAPAADSKEDPVKKIQEENEALKQQLSKLGNAVNNPGNKDPNNLDRAFNMYSSRGIQVNGQSPQQ